MSESKLDQGVRALQTHYPKIYLACHTRHQRARSTPARLSAQDSAVLAHLDESSPVRPAVLARHLGVAPSTLSATLTRLRALGYIRRQRRATDRREIELRRTSRGTKAMQGSSVLESRRVRRLLKRLSADERDRAVEGLAILARAAIEVMARETKGASP